MPEKQTDEYIVGWDPYGYTEVDGRFRPLTYLENLETVEWEEHTVEDLDQDQTVLMKSLDRISLELNATIQALDVVHTLLKNRLVG